MKKIMLIFLFCCSIIFGAQTACLVGGSSSAATNAGWFDSSVRSAVDAHNGNGANLFTDTGVTMREGGSGFVQIDIPDGTASSDWIGVYVNFTNSNGSETDGRNRITDVDTSGDPDTIDIYPLEWIDGTSCNIVVGGAVPATYNAVAYDLEDVLDDEIGDAATNSENVFILIYLSAAQEVTEQIMVDDQGGSGQYRKTLRGVDSNYAAYANGSYVEYIDTNDDAAGSIFKISVENVTFENIAAINPAGTGTPLGSEYCFEVIGTGKEFVARNCKAINGGAGFNISAVSGSLIDCVAYDSLTRQASMASHGASIIGGYYEFERTNARSGGYVIYFGALSGKIVGATIVGDVTGVGFGSYGSHLVLNCNFKNQTTQAILVNSADAMLLHFNNIYKLNATNLSEITLTSGSMYGDFNRSNVLTANTVLKGANDVSNLTTMSDTSPWVNAAKFTDNYRLDPLDGLIDNFKEAGWAPYMFTGITGTYIHAMSIGAYMTYDLPARDKVDSSDTVYGEPGTAAGGGLGAGTTNKSGGKQ